MTRAEKASEPSMDEILASIRRIIAEEPAGSRPLPAIPRAPMPLGAQPVVPDTKQQPFEKLIKSAPSLTPAAPAPASPSLPPLSPAPVDRLDAAVRPEAPVDPIAAAMSAAVAPLEPALAADPPLPAARLGERPVDARDRDLPFGRIAEALGNERQAAAARVAEAAPAPAPLRVEPTLPVGLPLESDLSDLLADPPLPPPAVAAPAAVPDAHAVKELPSLGDDRIAPRLETSGGRVFARRSIELGQALDAVPDRPTLMPPPAGSLVARLTEADSPDAASVAPAAPKLTAQSRVVDKMLSARTASAKVVPPIAEQLPSEPVVIAAMPEAAPAELSAPISLEPAIVEDNLDDLIETEDAQSALGMLAAGLAASASAPVNGSMVAVPAAPTPVAEFAPPADEVPTVVPASAADAPQDVAAVPFESVADALLATEPLPVPAVEASAPVPVVEASAVAPVAAAAPAPVAPAPIADALRPAVSTAAPSLAALAGLISPPSVTVAAPSTTSVAPAAAPLPVAAERAVLGVRTIEDMVAELLRPMLREWLAENMPRIVEKALRIELAEGLKTVNHVPRKAGDH